MVRGGGCVFLDAHGRDLPDSKATSNGQSVTVWILSPKGFREIMAFKRSDVAFKRFKSTC